MPLFQLPVMIHTKRISTQGIEIVYPQAAGLTNQKAEHSINQTIYYAVQHLYKEQMKAQTGNRLEMTGHYEIKTNERGILSLTLSNYAYTYPMAHGFTILKSLTFNVNTGRLYELGDLFKPGSNYVAVLEAAVNEQIRQRNIPVLNPGTQTVHSNQDYYLADKALVLYYQLYELAPYYYGFPMFPVSVYHLQSVIDEEGPLGLLSADIS